MAQGINRSRKDDNQDAIVEALEAAGCCIQSLAGVGRGVPDVLVGSEGKWYVIRICDPEDMEYNENISAN